MKNIKDTAKQLLHNNLFAEISGLNHAQGLQILDVLHGLNVPDIVSGSHIQLYAAIKRSGLNDVLLNDFCDAILLYDLNTNFEYNSYNSKLF